MTKQRTTKSTTKSTARRRGASITTTVIPSRPIDVLRPMIARAVAEFLSNMQEAVPGNVASVSNEPLRLNLGTGPSAPVGVSAAPQTFADLVTSLDVLRERLGVAVGGLSVGIERLTGETLLPNAPGKPVEAPGQVGRAHAILADCFMLVSLLEDQVQRVQRQC